VKKALKMPEIDEELAEVARAQLRLYEQRQPYRDE
jgi:hypothetical protein